MSNYLDFASLSEPRKSICSKIDAQQSLHGVNIKKLSGPRRSMPGGEEYIIMKTPNKDEYSVERRTYTFAQEKTLLEPDLIAIFKNPYGDDVKAGLKYIVRNIVPEKSDPQYVNWGFNILV